tara:strand:+ start:4360 stop:5457 length:1098 start_codon:yes stop_codon:yes gene_type:complete
MSRISNRNIVLPKIGQGVGEYNWKDKHTRIIREGIYLGANLIDTAESYDDGNSEKIVEKAIRGIRDKVIIATKFSPENHRKEDVVKSLEKSLKRLNTDYIDIYQLHWPNPDVNIEETLESLARLKESGKILEIGMSNLRFNKFKEISESSDIFSFQLEYNLFDRCAEDQILPFCKRRNISFLAYSPLDKGRIVSGKKSLELLTSLAKKYEASLSQIALAWISRHESVITIPKSTNIEHLKSNIKAISLNISEEDMESISLYCKNKLVDISPDDICVTNAGEGSRKTYQTLEEAYENKLNYVPSPLSLSGDITEDDSIKPIRVIKNKNNSSSFKYNLVEGRVRYWAWVMKFGNIPVPCLIRNSVVR